jgi:hypothetical protein
MDTGSTNKWNASAGHVNMIQEEPSSATWRHVPSQSTPADLIKRNWVFNINNIHTTVDMTTQVITEAINEAYNGGQHSNRYLELRNVYVALRQPLEDITWKLRSQ